MDTACFRPHIVVGQRSLWLAALGLLIRVPLPVLFAGRYGEFGLEAPRDVTRTVLGAQAEILRRPFRITRPRTQGNNRNLKEESR